LPKKRTRAALRSSLTILASLLDLISFAN
jgi:hypothetical protein